MTFSQIQIEVEPGIEFGFDHAKHRIEWMQQSKTLSLTLRESTGPIVYLDLTIPGGFARLETIKSLKPIHSP